MDLASQSSPLAGKWPEDFLQRRAQINGAQSSGVLKKGFSIRGSSLGRPDWRNGSLSNNRWSIHDGLEAFESDSGQSFVPVIVRPIDNDPCIIDP